MFLTHSLLFFFTLCSQVFEMKEEKRRVKNGQKRRGDE
jgi:hypothetical protein